MSAIVRRARRDPWPTYTYMGTCPRCSASYAMLCDPSEMPSTGPRDQRMTCHCCGNDVWLEKARRGPLTTGNGSSSRVAG